MTVQWSISNSASQFSSETDTIVDRVAALLILSIIVYEWLVTFILLLSWQTVK